MRSKKVIVQNEHGIHARVALRVLERSKNLDSKVTLCKGCAKADGCSILDMLLLEASKGSEIELVVSGGDEERSINADRRFLMHLGHPEYDAKRLVEEYRRDMKEGRAGVSLPKNLNIDNPLNRWKGQGSEFFSQWIRYIHKSISF